MNRNGLNYILSRVPEQKKRQLQQKFNEYEVLMKQIKQNDSKIRTIIDDLNKLEKQQYQLSRVSYQTDQMRNNTQQRKQQRQKVSNTIQNLMSKWKQLSTKKVQLTRKTNSISNQLVNNIK